MAGGLALAAVLTLCLGYGIVDDAYISLRYADNLAHGHGLVFNPGERVEGYSNFLWTVLLALGLELGLPGPQLAVGLGLACAALLLPAAHFLHSRHLTFSGGAESASSTPLALAISTPLLCYSASGLETTLFTLLLVVSASLVLRGLRHPRALLGAAAGFAAANLTRPEATAAAAFTVAFLGILAWRRSTTLRWHHVAGFVAMFTVLFGSYLLWRHATYGAWLPNTYYAKVGTLSWPLLRRGLSYAGPLYLLFLTPLLLPAVVVIPSLRRDARALFVAGLAATLLLGVVLEGGDHLALYRFGVPLLPFVIILAREVIEAGWRWWTRSRQGVPQTRAGLAVLLVLAAAGSLLTAGATRMHGMSEHARARLEVNLAADWAEFGRWLADHSQPDDAVAVLPIGAIGYFSRRPVIDLVGMTDAHIAHLNLPTGSEYIGHEKFDNAYVLARKPRFVLAHHLVVFDRPLDQQTYDRSGYFRVHRALVDMPGFHRDYAFRLVTTDGGRCFAFYERKPPAAVRLPT